MRTKLVRCLLIVGLCLAVGLPLVNAGEIERIQAKGKLVVSLNKGYPPFSMLIDGQPAGLDVDLARLLAEYLGVKAGATHEIFARDLFPASAAKLYPTAAEAAEAIKKARSMPWWRTRP